MSHESLLHRRPLAWVISLVLPSCYGGASVDATRDTADSGGDSSESMEWPEEAFPGVPGTPATLTLMTRNGPVEVAYLHLDNGYGVLEGDILLYGPEGSGMRSHSGVPDGLTSDPRPQRGGVTTELGKRWIDRQILWQYDPDPMWMPPEGGVVRTRFEQAIADFMAEVDVTFVEYDPVIHGANPNRISVRTKVGAGCSSFVGRQSWRPQALTLGPECGKGAVLHELSHAIGLHHEQDRADRDLHVTVNKANAVEKYAHLFDAPNLTDDIGAYNTNSMMHYGSCSFSRCKVKGGEEAVRCFGVDAEMNMFECRYGPKMDAACAHCDCGDEDACRFPTILGPGGTPLKKEKGGFQPSDIDALEYALGCPDGVDGDYCGDVVGLNLGTLYTCANGYYDVKKVCDNAGCKPSLAPGSNDSCASGTPDPDATCATGPCCESGEFSPPGTVCAEDADVEYICPWGTDVGADVGVRRRDRTCSGSSGACNGVYGDWKPDEVHDVCSDAEYCHPGDPSCNNSPPVPDCDGGACCDPNGFWLPPGHVCVDDEDSEYGCPWGISLGDDVGVRFRDLTCSGSSSACDGSYAPWESWQTTDDCSSVEICTPGQMTCSCDKQFEVLSYEYPNWGPPGCSGDGSLKLKASAELVSATLLRMHVRKADDTAFSGAATLSLYVGSPIQCPDPPNVVKDTQGVAIGEVEQTIDLSLNPYDGAWAVNEIKEFWVGKDEGGFASFRGTDLVSVRRLCIP